mmetsp:Transcript_29407/g.37956  ORF Transcript_29407/g.37956 Transcript_29407/m.37956 type:complete len:102 (-) Transcript_29407:24-329(-)
MLTCRDLTRAGAQATRAPTAASLPVLAITTSVRLLTSAPISGVIREALVTSLCPYFSLPPTSACSKQSTKHLLLSSSSVKVETPPSVPLRSLLRSFSSLSE